MEKKSILLEALSFDISVSFLCIVYWHYLKDTVVISLLQHCHRILHGNMIRQLDIIFVLQTRLYVRATLNILKNVYNVPKCAGSFLTKEDENFPVHDFPPSLPKNSTTKKKKNFSHSAFISFFFLSTLKNKKPKLINQSN